MVEQGDFIGIPDALLEFRVHSNSVSKKNLDIQIALSRKIAIRHCMNFMHLNESEAERALNALSHTDPTSNLKDWFWLLFHCLPRLGRQGIELWMCAAKHTLRRVVYR